MTVRQNAHAEEERAVFNAFLAAYPSFASSIKEVRQPDDQFPDVTVILMDGGEIDFELGEWLHGVQMAAAKRREQLVASIEEAIGPHGPNPSRHFRAVMLTPLDSAPALTAAHKNDFKAALGALIEDTEQRWPGDGLWQSPQGRVCRDLGAYPPLDKYLLAVHFDPLVVRGEPRPWRSGQPWIVNELPGGAYSAENALGALVDILTQKITHYGRFSRPTRLVIYYGKAAVYNTPYRGIEMREFKDVAVHAADAVRDQEAFEKIYLLSALEPGPEVYEIYPACARCT